MSGLLKHGQELKRFIAAARRMRVRLSRDVLCVSVRRQRVSLFTMTPSHGAESPANPAYRPFAEFVASTSRFGTGQNSGSNRTPLGLHRVAEKIGAGWPVGTVFRSRLPVGFTWKGIPDAAIVHRILWLDGLEPGFNRGGNVDSFARYIYIHGLADEPSLGRPASCGCIHLAANDLIPLFDRIRSGTLVWIE